ncbi:MAG: nucleotidyl transferase AbiEii/AbiGii toxin family protein [bacterium]|nr:nucleotidyl transferase AbiEii/AbiGii toxin family protein [bacterium]
MNLQELIRKYVDNGYTDEDASSKVCQDLILTSISNSKYRKNITIKGGVVIHNLSNDIRRATRDLDLDFIKYSLEDNSIRIFVSELDKSFKDINIEITDDIVPLHHQDYNGKRVFLRIKDNFKNEIDTKLDIGVHKLFELEQELYMFDFNTIKLGASLLINSPDQIFAEKMKSLLKFNIRSTRYKDIFDFYYLIDNNLLNKEKLEKCLKVIIYNDESLNINSLVDLIKQFKKITHSRLYKNNLNNPKYNWLDKNIDEVINKIHNYLESLETTKV